MNINEFNQICYEFADRNQRIIRTEGWDTIRKALANGEQVIIITASIENWVKPFFKEFGNQIKVEGTKIDVRINQITGQFLTQNCYGVEKTKRLKEVFPYRQAYELIAFGDSDGDRYLLNEADESHYKPFRNEKTDKTGEFIRFGIVGVVATAIQYGLYLLLLKWLQPQISNTIGYAISFVFNYIASTKFTFKVKSTAKKGAGFAFSHLINYVLQTVFLTLFLWLGLPKNIALIPVFCICVPINFLLVRLFLKKNKNEIRTCEAKSYILCLEVIFLLCNFAIR